MIHASGKFVPSLVSQISDNLETPDTGDILKNYQSLVIEKMHLKAGDDYEAKMSEIQIKLEEQTPKVRDIALNFKKSKNWYF